MENAPRTQEERAARLRDVRAGLEDVADGLGKGLDAGIVESVAALNAVGFETSGSCEGHAGWGLPYPWVDVQASGEPEHRTAWDRRRWQVALEELAARRGVEDLETLRHGHFDDLAPILRRLGKELPEPENEPDLPEWVEWRARQDSLEVRLAAALERFQDEKGEELARAGLEVRAEQGATDVRVVGLLSGEGEAFSVPYLEQKAIVDTMPRDEATLARRREAMEAFTRWVRERWLAGEDF